MTAAGHSGFRRNGLASRAVMFMAALAFVLQSYVTQTHIHAGSADLGGAAKVVAAQTSTQGKTSHDHNPVDCPFCQAIAVAGAFVAATTPVLHRPFAWVVTQMREFTARTMSVRTVHNWQSRAPPRF